MDEREFFCEVTLRICGSLELEHTLHHCLLYLKQSIPIQAAAISCIDRAAQTERVVALATAEQGRQMNLVIAMTPAEVAHPQDRPTTQVEWANHVQDGPVALTFGELLGLGQEVSMIVLPLVVEGQHIGAVRFFARGRDRYGPGHADRMGLIAGPFSIALSNYLHYRELRELKEQLAEECRNLQAELNRLGGGAQVVGAEAGLERVEALDQVVSEHIRRVLRLTRGRIEGKQGAAELLGLHPSTLRKRMRKLRIPFGRSARQQEHSYR